MWRDVNTLRAELLLVYFRLGRLQRVYTYVQQMRGIIGHVTVEAGNPVGTDGAPPHGNRYSKTMEAHPGAIEAKPGPVEVYLRAVEHHSRALDAQPGPVEVILRSWGSSWGRAGSGACLAHPGAMEAHPGLDPWRFIF
jgi:hypothetical protein